MSRNPTHAFNTDNVIAWFDDFDDDEYNRNEYRFLSNFFQGEPLHDGYWTYLTGEHMFAAYKTKNLDQFHAIRNAYDPNEAKAMGRSCNLRADWEWVKYDVMRYVLALKFQVGEDLGERLLETGDRLLVEGTWWKDTVWGVDLNRDRHENPQRRPGRNWLGTLLMARRAEMRAEKLGAEPFNYSHTALFAQGRA